MAAAAPNPIDVPLSPFARRVYLAAGVIMGHWAIGDFYELIKSSGARYQLPPRKTAADDKTITLYNARVVADACGTATHTMGSILMLEPKVIKSKAFWRTCVPVASAAVAANFWYIWTASWEVSYTRNGNKTVLTSKLPPTKD
jgi:hypothetical protein